jgi:uncharacterized protein YndB with AHSA1/START domain
MPSRSPERVIHAETIVNASLDRAWDAWTTEEGIKSFLAPACNIDAHVEGPYEIFFDPEAEPGRRGAEDAKILGEMKEKNGTSPSHTS